MTRPTRFSSNPRPPARRLTTTGWYLVALGATSISTFSYLFVLRRIVAHDPSATLESVEGLYWVAGLVAPIVVALKGAGIATILWGGQTLFNLRISFSRCLAIAWSAEVLLVLPQFVSAVAGWLRGATRRTDIYVPLGLDVFWHPSDLSWSIVSHGISICLLAWAVVVWVRLRADSAGDRRWPASLTTAIATVVLVLLPVLQLSP